MTNEELKKKIVEIVNEITIKVEGISFIGTAESIADALIAAGIGDVEYERFVFKKAYMDFFTRFNRDKEFHKNFDSVTLGCQIGKFEDMMEKTKKELAEERKDD